MSLDMTPDAQRSATTETEMVEAGGLRPHLIYEVIRREGEEELSRSFRALIWSGVAAGLLISFSVIGEATLRAALPDMPWRAILENFGYSLGFLIVILGRMQLFTENTITTVLPVLARRTPACLAKLLRLWLIVLSANVVGAAAAAGFFTLDGALPEEIRNAALEISQHAVTMGPAQTFLRAIPAGVLIAALVWAMPQTQGGKVAVIVLFTWLIAMGDFAHVVAGTVELVFVLIASDLTFWRGVPEFWLPALGGNILGGTLVFTALAWAQVREEVEKS